MREGDYFYGVKIGEWEKYVTAVWTASYMETREAKSDSRVSQGGIDDEVPCPNAKPKALWEAADRIKLGPN